MKPVRRTVRIAVVGVAMVVGLAVSSSIAGAGVGQTKTLLTNTNRYCGGQFISPSTQTFGSATMNQSKANKNSPANLSAGLTIRGAAWGATYRIRLIQVDSGGNALGDSCQAIVGTVTLDPFGNGTATASGRVLPGATQWWVVLNNQADPADFFDTDLAPIV